MKEKDVKKSIIGHLEDIADKLSYINHYHPARNLSLDIDLVKDELRLLYRDLEYLKAMAGDGPDHSGPASSDQVRNEPAADTSGADDRQPSAVNVEQKDKEPGSQQEPSGKQTLQTEEKANTGTDNQGEAAPAKSAEQQVSHKQANVPDEQEKPRRADPVGSGDTQKAHSPDTGQSKQTDEPDYDRDLSERASKQPSGNDTDKPAASETATPRPSASKAVIDILAEYGTHTIGDQYLQEDNSLHQHISGNQEDRSIGARMQQQPVSNLKDVIGVNEKFLFINELFQGNIQEYREALDRLNQMDGIKQAFDYLNELAMQYAWDANRSASTIEKLANYVQRRYMQ
ncbi:MAG: hypothetical protein R6U62_09880 [Bacteroidales bacterium]